MDNTWIKKLASHYEKCCVKYPHKKRLILLNIDGTVLDERYVIHYTLSYYDVKHGTQYFKDFHPEDIKVTEEHIDHLVQELPLSFNEKVQILTWLLKNIWRSKVTYKALHPHKSILEIIRWFQMQPNTYVGLNTNRSDLLKEATVTSLNIISRPYRVQFDEKLLFMRPHQKALRDIQTKMEGLKHFQRQGYHVSAVIDNEAEQLNELVEQKRNKDILYINSSLIHQSEGTQSTLAVNENFARAQRDHQKDILPWMGQHRLNERIHFVWQNISNQILFKEFCQSDIFWGEVHLQIDNKISELIVRSKSFEKQSLRAGENIIFLSEWMESFKKHRKGLRVCFDNSHEFIDLMVNRLAEYENDVPLWFSGSWQCLVKNDFDKIAKRFPHAILSTPIDFMGPLFVSVPQKTKKYLTILKSWGVKRLSVSWYTPEIRMILNYLNLWGFEVNITGIKDLRVFLEAVMLHPTAITADFQASKREKMLNRCRSNNTSSTVS